MRDLQCLESKAEASADASAWVAGNERLDLFRLAGGVGDDRDVDGFAFAHVAALVEQRHDRWPDSIALIIELAQQRGYFRRELVDRTGTAIHMQFGQAGERNAETHHKAVLVFREEARRFGVVRCRRSARFG